MSLTNPKDKGGRSPLEDIKFIETPPGPYVYESNVPEAISNYLNKLPDVRFVLQSHLLQERDELHKQMLGEDVYAELEIERHRQKERLKMERIEALKRAKELLEESSQLVGDLDHQLDDQLYYAAERLDEVIDRQPDEKQKLNKQINEGLYKAYKAIKEVELSCEGFNDVLAFHLSEMASTINTWQRGLE